MIVPQSDTDDLLALRAQLEETLRDTKSGIEALAALVPTMGPHEYERYHQLLATRDAFTRHIARIDWLLGQRIARIA